MAIHLLHADASSAQHSFSSDIFMLDRDFEISKRPYVLTNESNQPATVAALRSIPRPDKPFHIGFSGWENYNLMVARQSCGALLGDINNTVMELFRKTQATVLLSKTRQDFVENILLELEPQKERFFREDCGMDSSAIRSELTREGSWLSTDASYGYVQSLYAEGKIAHIRLDISDRAAFAKVDAWLKANQLTCDSQYLSNIGDWFLLMEDGGKGIRSMKASVNRIITESTVIIDASEHFYHPSGSLPQRVLQTFPYDPEKALSKLTL